MRSHPFVHGEKYYKPPHHVKVDLIKKAMKHIPGSAKLIEYLEPKEKPLKQMKSYQHDVKNEGGKIYTKWLYMN